MVYDFSLTLMKPSKPVQTEAPDAKQIFLHAGENEAQYQSFIEAVSDLAQAFKFLPKYDQLNYKYGVPNVSTDPVITAEYDESLFEFDYTNDEIFGNFSKQTEPGYGTKIWGEGLGRAFSNLEFSPDASDWDLLDGISTGSGQSFYQIAKSGAISTYSDEQAYNLMCLMTESKERVFSVLYDIFGDPEKLGAHEDLNLNGIDDVIDHISSWLDAHASVDPHNLGVLKMFFGMQTDFINTLDAYVNCQTYWGGDLTTPVFSSDLGDFSETLRVKAESYISTLSGDAKTAAESLESKWFSPAPRYDKVGETWTGDLTLAKKVSDCQLAVNAALAAYNNCAQTVYDKALAAYDSAVAANADHQTLLALNAALFIARANLTDGSLVQDTLASPAEQSALLANLQDAQNAFNDAKANYADFETNSSGSWVEFFQDRMDEFGAKEVIRVITCHIFNRSSNQKYKKLKADYEDRKDDAMQQDIFLQRMQAKNKAANRQTFRKNVARSANVSKAIRTAGVRGSSGTARRATIAGVRMPAVIRRASVAGVRAPSVRAMARGPVAGTRPISGRRSPVISAKPSARVTPKHFVSGPVTRRVSPRVVAAGGQGIRRPAAARPVGHIGARSGGAPAIPSKIRSAAPSVAPKPQAQAPKHSKDEKKVI